MTPHEILVAKWTECKNGIKQRVLNDEMPEATVKYIIDNPTYSNEDKINWVIKCIEKHTIAFYEEATEMYNKIVG